MISQLYLTSYNWSCSIEIFSTFVAWLFTLWWSGLDANRERGWVGGSIMWGGGCVCVCITQDKVTQCWLSGGLTILILYRSNWKGESGMLLSGIDQVTGKLHHDRGSLKRHLCYHSHLKLPNLSITTFVLKILTPILQIGYFRAPKTL